MTAFYLLNVPGNRRRPMTVDETGTFIRAHAMEKVQPAKPIEQVETDNADAPFALKMAMRRIAVMAPGTEIGFAPFLFALSLCDNPAKVVLWCYYFVRRTRELGRALTLMDLAEDFPIGFPTDDGYSLAWDGQKSSAAGFGGNLLDLPGTWFAESMAG